VGFGSVVRVAATADFNADDDGLSDCNSDAGNEQAPASHGLPRQVYLHAPEDSDDWVVELRSPLKTSRQASSADGGGRPTEPAPLVQGLGEKEGRSQP
jgi:hypothetical protein